PHWLQAASALTGGVFLYVATADILPEVMHSKAAIGWKLALLTLGVGVMWLFTHWPGHVH
ncbi:MAG TPA: hypothetical protein VLB27_05075, partial [candidate division Zixibacteria bacterium]|nr:hypothetical protein [candidate division Zixibacteria bacterium]